MDNTLVKFGDVFRHREREYVFLAETDDAVYAARILNERETQRFETLADQLTARAANPTRIGSSAFSYVILNTEEFRDRAAHLASTEHSEHQTSRFDVFSTLTAEDCASIARVILSENSHVSMRLIEIVRGLNISQVQALAQDADATPPRNS